MTLNETTVRKLDQEEFNKLAPEYQFKLDSILTTLRKIKLNGLKFIAVHYNLKFI